MMAKKAPTTDERRDVAIFSANQTVAGADRRLAEFQVKLADDPAHAFSWSLQTMEWAARRHVARIVLRLLTEDPQRSIDDVITTATDEALRMAEFPERSTSVVSNTMHQLTAAAWANFARDGAF